MPLSNLVMCPSDLDSYPRCSCIRRAAVNGSKFYFSGEPGHLALCAANLGTAVFLFWCSTNPVCISSTAYSTGSLIHQYRGLHGNASQAKYEQIYYSSAYYDEKNVQDLDFSFI